MSRVIKTKVWLTIEKCWFKQFYLAGDGAIYDWNGFILINAVAVEFAGIKDKNGVEIYEGDIVEYAHSNKSKGRVRSEVIFDQHGFTVAVNNSILNDDAVLMACVVVGNIYQNPELLK